MPRLPVHVHCDMLAPEEAPGLSHPFLHVLQVHNVEALVSYKADDDLL